MTDAVIPDLPNPGDVAQHHDFIVVGSGAGGGPLAANLARAGRTVLLLEAGEDAGTTWNYQVPAFSCLASEDPAMQWDYFVRHYANDARQRRDPKFVEQQNGVFYPRSGTLGGCTAHNALITTYPQNSDWDAIADLTGDDSWRSDAMRSYFERLERCEYRPISRFLAKLGWNPGRRGFSGWLPLSVPHPLMILRDPELLIAVLKSARGAIRALRNPFRVIRREIRGMFDPNDWSLAVHNDEGLRFTPLAIEDGGRFGTRDYIRRAEAECQGRLVVETGALVTRVLFDESRRATGVEYMKGQHLYRADPAAEGTATPGERSTASAKHDVIIAAGAFNTPQLLKLSGVGPARELERFAIPVVIDLAGVGENLQDRYECTVVFRMKRDFKILEGATMRGPEPGQPGDKYFQQWRKGKGPYAANGGAVCLIKRSSKAATTDPDLFIFSGAGNFRGYYPGYSKDLTREHNYLTWAVLKAHTVNTSGRVTLRSADPRDVPQIDFHYFEEGNDAAGGDLDAVAEGIEFVREMSRPLAHLIDAEEVPGPKVQTREELREFVKSEAWGHHASCSCKMGPASDPLAVVDSRFRVHGTQNLRVIDASIFPRIPGYFIVSAIYMISEKATDVILEDAGEAG